MSLTTLSEWLRCPICFLPLEAMPPLALGCDDGHRFDVNKHGYVSMLATQPRVAGDTPQMLDARADLLSSGAYDAVAHLITENVLGGRTERVIDAGTGTGHYSAKISSRLSRSARILATDIAADAVRRSVRHIGRERADGLVADTWRPLPIRDGVADAVVNVFAPRNPEEFRRVLKDDGRLVIALPQQDHLIELREALPMLDVPPDKSQRLAEDFSAHFTLEHSATARYRLSVTRDTAVALRTMGPSGHHTAAQGPMVPAALPREVTVAVDVLRFRPNTVRPRTRRSDDQLSSSSSVD
ncbi:methyltransferase domain-containing protein [Planctomonas sp. JC2975]|uniref:putative RNA methyltransferase n=1 Tax=Planctomonas sp. JC2975 TaxID=2729626 RepID=UPI0014732FC2|nr:methyltransferase domain-containing protein [Planctomonas sp. JC2975]NNC10428.1 methyltransferase domain-containing protein [Planctomonas sp. JC2975]